MTTPLQIRHLLPENTLDIEAICTHLDDLIADQNRRIQQAQPLSPVPLLWLAMALASGLEVTIENAVVAGAHCAMSAARTPGWSLSPTPPMLRTPSAVFARGRTRRRARTRSRQNPSGAALRSAAPTPLDEVAMGEFLDFFTPALVIIVTLFLLQWLVKLLWRGYWTVQSAQLDLEQRRLELARQAADARLVTLTANAMLVSRQLVESGALTPHQLRLMLEEILTHRPPESAPHALRIDYRPTSAGAPPAAQAAAGNSEPQRLPPPRTFWDLWHSGELPRGSFLMGYSLDDGQPVRATWRQLYSALIGGQSGSGKSTLIRCVLAQAALQGGKFVVIDPHFGAGEESLGASLAPLQHLMLCEVASTISATLATVNYVHQIGRRRIDGSDRDRTPLVLVVDETTTLLSRGSLATDLTGVLAEIAQEMRKVAVFAFCIGQQFKADIMDSAVRNSFVSMISCRARREVARVQSGSNEFGKLAESLTVGQAVWMNPGGETIRIAAPNTTQQHIVAVARHLTPGSAPRQYEDGKFRTTSLHPVSPTPQPPITLSPQDAHALTLFKNGASLKAIVSGAYQVTPPARPTPTLCAASCPLSAANCNDRRFPNPESRSRREPTP